MNELTAAVVQRAKTLILDDIHCNVIPISVTSFSELHDYVDANEYLIPEEDIDFDTLVEIADEAAVELDKWISGWGQI